MTELPHEPLPVTPYDRPQLLAHEVSRLAFLTELLQPDSTGEPGAYLLPADHDGDEKPETWEMVLTEKEVWRIYRDEVLLPEREAFLSQEPSGQVISGHMAMVTHLGRWADHVRQFERLIPKQPQPEPDRRVVAEWAMENLGIDMENVFRTAPFAEADAEAYETVAFAIAMIEGAYRGLQTTTLVLMAVHELQIGHKDLALHLEDGEPGIWRVKTITGNGNLELTRIDNASPYAQRRIASVEEVMAWNDLHFVPGQASSVHDAHEETLKEQ
jgi:hypothetical protein